MTAMRLKRYPSPSGGIALGKMGVGATMIRDPILPVGARWVEYLESTGTQWIDTGYIASLDTEFEIEVYFVGEGCPLAARESASSRRFGVSSGTYYGLFVNNGDGSANQWKVAPKIDFLSKKYNLKKAYKSLWVNGVLDQISRGISFTTPNTVSMFALNQLGTILQFFTGRIYFCDIGDEVSGYKQFRPIAIGNTGYMLDLLTGDYLQYGNAGTGDFVIGPDTNAPAI